MLFFSFIAVSSDLLRTNSAGARNLGYLLAVP
jgi:hypothetical protein